MANKAPGTQAENAAGRPIVAPADARQAELDRQAAQVAAIEGVTRDKDGNPKPITPA